MKAETSPIVKNTKNVPASAPGMEAFIPARQVKRRKGTGAARTVSGERKAICIPAANITTLAAVHEKHSSISLPFTSDLRISQSIKKESRRLSRYYNSYTRLF